MSTTTTTDDNLATISELYRDLHQQGVNATISELAEMPEDQRHEIRDWLVNPRPDTLPACLVAFYDEPDPIDRDKLREGLRDNGFEVPSRREITDAEAKLADDWLRMDTENVPDWLKQLEQEQRDAEDAARRLQEIRDAEVAVCEAESEMNAIKEDLKDAKAAYEARVLRLRETIKRQSSPQRELPFGDGAGSSNGQAVAAPPDPAGDESLDILITAKLRTVTGTDIDGLTAKKVSTLMEACGGTTIAKLEKWFRENPHWNGDLPGFGEEWITRLQDAHLAYRQARPMPSDEQEEQPLEITDTELANVLMLVELKPSDEQVASWSPAERDAVHQWCGAVFHGRDVPELFPACLADVVPVDMQADPVGYLNGQD